MVTSMAERSHWLDGIDLPLLPILRGNQRIFLTQRGILGIICTKQRRYKGIHVFRRKFQQIPLHGDRRTLLSDQSNQISQRTPEIHRISAVITEAVYVLGAKGAFYRQLRKIPGCPCSTEEPEDSAEDIQRRIHSGCISAPVEFPPSLPAYPRYDPRRKIPALGSRYGGRPGRCFSTTGQ